jgi:hypothetical protein
MVAAEGCEYGQQLKQQQWELSQQQQEEAEDLTLTASEAASEGVARLGAAVLEKLLREWRSLSDSGQASTGSVVSSSSSGSSSSSTLPVFQSCAFMLEMLIAASGLAPDAKPLQDCVRMVAQATAAAAPAPAAPFTRSLRQQLHYTASIVRSISSCLVEDDDHSESFGFPADVVSLLVAAHSTAGDVSSPDALQQFGLLVSLQQTYSKLDIQHMPEVLAAVCSMADAAVDRPPFCAEHSGAQRAAGSSSGCACTAALPWLVLLGRCCYVCAVLVQRWQVHSETNGAFPGSLIQRMGILEALQQLHSSLTGVVQWLAAAGTVQRLTALGYDPVNMQQTLAAPTQVLLSLSNALQDADLDPGSTATALTVLKDIQVQLQAAGRVLVRFAIPLACNNPGCGNVCGPSEAQLVGRRSCICAGCLTARNCGRACQRAAWRQHKPVCKALAAAAAAAAAAATPVGGEQGAASPGSGSSTAE